MAVKRRKHTPDQVVRKLREADRLLAGGKVVAEVAKHLEISEQIYHLGRQPQEDSAPVARRGLKGASPQAEAPTPRDLHLPCRPAPGRATQPRVGPRFQFDQTADGRILRLLNIVDQHSREETRRSRQATYRRRSHRPSPGMTSSGRKEERLSSSADSTGPPSPPTR